MKLFQNENLEINENDKIAIYGIGSETKRILSEEFKKFTIVGLLDSFQDSGKIYGYPIISIYDAIKEKVKIIIVVARPGSCNAIQKNIGRLCEENNILLFDIRGNNLLEKNQISYEFPATFKCNKNDLMNKIIDADVVSFDLFDTLIVRSITDEKDIFDLVDLKLKENGIFIPDFVKLRLAVEKELSRDRAPKLHEIYDELLKKIGGAFITSHDFAEIEATIDLSLCIARNDMVDILNFSNEQNKQVIITTDTYYNEEVIKKFLNKVKIFEYDKIFISSEYDTSKTQNLFNCICENYRNNKILHIGNDETSDIIHAEKWGIKTFRIYASTEIFNILGGVGLEKNINTISDKIKIGLFVSHIFNSPFTVNLKKIIISYSYNIGYLIFAPIITDFVLWLKQRCDDLNINQILFFARDGYLIGKLYRKINQKCKSVYFLTSRIAAIRAGVKTDKDIDYVEEMKYSGSDEESFDTRFNVDPAIENKKMVALKMAKIKGVNYKRYIDKLSLDNETLGVFDFVAKGTVQFFLKNLLRQHLKGFYFIQQEPESMKDKNLDIEPFFSEEEKNTSEIFKDYYILETILTSPYPSIKEFDKNGAPIFDEETRPKESLEYVKEAGKGIEDYFSDYINLVSEENRVINKKLDEAILSLINKICITDKKFLSLKVEDPFFGRYTNLKDVLL